MLHYGAGDFCIFSVVVLCGDKFFVCAEINSSYLIFRLELFVAGMQGTLWKLKNKLQSVGPMHGYRRFIFIMKPGREGVQRTTDLLLSLPATYNQSIMSAILLISDIHPLCIDYMLQNIMLQYS